MAFFKLKKTANLAKRSHKHLVKEIKKTVNNSELFKALFQAEKAKKPRPDFSSGNKFERKAYCLTGTIIHLSTETVIS